MTLRNCIEQQDCKCTMTSNVVLRRIHDGAFGFKKTILMQKLQKVYARVSVQCGQSLAKIRIGILDNGTWYIQEKIGRKKQTLSVVNNCKSNKVDVIVTIEIADEIVITEFVTETVGDTRIEKRILDKIKYCDQDIVNNWKGDTFRLRSESGQIKRKAIDCSLECGKIYWIKVLVKEITNCGKMWLDCGHNHGEQKGQLIKAFKYTGKLPEIAIKGNKFDYIVDVLAVVIAEANTIELADFLKKEYWR